MSHLRELKRFPLTAGIALAMSTPQLYASGFALIENSASGMGNAFSGASAVAEDASTVWFNPAAMTALPHKSQMVAAGHIIVTTADFSDRGSNVNPALTGGVVPGSLSGKNDDGGKVGLIPNFYYTRPLRENLMFGLGVNVPFGLETNYDDDWVGRYHALKSAIITLNLNPSLAWQINDKISLGAGISAQYVKADLTSAIDSAAVCLKAANGNPATIAACGAAGLSTPAELADDSKAELEADDWSFGFNLGALIKASDRTRIGIAYRSEVDQDATGTADFTINPKLQPILDNINAQLQPLNKALLVDTDISASVSLPAIASLSVAHQLNDKLTLLGDITWTGWSSFQELRIKYDSGQDDSVTDESWDDVLRYSIGANYAVNKRLVLRTGVAFDEEAIPDPQHRTPRIPGNDRTWLSFGGGYFFRDNARIDVGYSHLFVDDTPIDHTDDNGYALRGVYKASVDILSAQLTWNF